MLSKAHRDAIAAAAEDPRRTARRAWLNPNNASLPSQFSQRTMTNLYNRRPDVARPDAHEALDEAVFAAYGWATELSDDEILERLLELNQERASEQE